MPYYANNHETMAAKKRADDAISTVRLLLPIPITVDEVVSSQQICKRLEIAKKLADKLLQCDAKMKRLKEAMEGSDDSVLDSINCEICKQQRTYKVLFNVLLRLKLNEDDLDTSPALDELLKNQADEQILENELCVLEAALNLNNDFEAKCIVGNILKTMSTDATQLTKVQQPINPKDRKKEMPMHAM